ncbi:BTB/POZ domain-containing protein-like protein [Emericellopsis cladophorae]|uniref:BTB/POZ domain-containing protein-like protein n=1 Tax=Emericellopsis cladophorae TaxID=2686198 RepID=A0A9P9Y7F9_9HYPO|nr:BTB/POZ domain-containing protein-like protein [Emericellopsis cladophorae]KAI6784274.1 BTB/POZ domain-containing protein-like protein [Emericellopsis cladophorae]
MVLKKYELEGTLAEENLMIKAGTLRDENPLDTSENFQEFLLACRHGDLRKCQELINLGVNINGKDKFDYTPLIIASLCGHYELVRLLLESGALAERNTFQGERCIYNALNDRIRNLLLQYDFSKSSDPYVYWSTHISSLINNPNGLTDIALIAGNDSFDIHKFILAARTPYFNKKLTAQPETTQWKLSAAIPTDSFQIALRYVYLGAVPRDLVAQASDVSEEDVLKGLDKLSKQLEIEQLWEAIMAGSDRRLARQRYEDEVRRALRQMEAFFQANVLGRKMFVDSDRVDEVVWKHDNSIFADVLLRADEPLAEDEASPHDGAKDTPVNAQGIPIGPAAAADTTNGTTAAKPRKSILYPAHKAMLIRSEYFEKMFSGDFVESRRSDNLRIVTLDCTPEILELILTFLYTESTDRISLDQALDLLYAADMLFLDTLKSKAAVAISTLGSGSSNVNIGEPIDEKKGVEVEPVNIYDVIRAAWDLRVQRLEEFAARYIAYRLEDYIDDGEFQDMIQESASRIKERQETDTIELLDDIRYYLSERFRLRFEDTGLEDVMDEEGEIDAQVAAQIADAAEGQVKQPSADVAGTNGWKPEDKGLDSGNKEKLKEEEDSDGDDEFVADAMSYQNLLGKIDMMLERLKLDA